MRFQDLLLHFVGAVLIICQILRHQHKALNRRLKNATIVQEECLEDGPWALGLQASGRAELADLTAEEIAASSNSGVQQGADHDDIYAAR